MKKFLIKKANFHTDKAIIAIGRIKGDLEFQKIRNKQKQIYQGMGINSKGAVTIFLVMSIMVAILAIALGSSSVLSGEISSSLNSGETIKAYYAAETGIEFAMYQILQNQEPADNGTNTVCPNPPGNVCSIPASSISKDIDADGINDYTLYVTGCLCDNSITKMQSVGEYKNTSRSIRTSFY